MSDVIEIDADVTETEYLTADVATTESIDADVTESVGGGGGATDYEVLVNKPQINGVTLVGDLSTADLGIHAGVQDVLVDDVSIVDSNYEAHIPIANQQRTGLIPATWMDKLFHIENGAQKNVQADWNQTFSSFDDYIKNKPNLATVAESGSYNDLLNKPKISEIQNDAGYVAYLSQFGIAYLEATDDYAGSSLNEGKFFTGYMPQTQPAPFYLSNGSLIAVKFPTDAVRRPREGGAYAAPALRIYTRLQPPDSYTSYIPINYKGTMIPSKQIKANDIALLVYDSDNDCFEHLGHTDVEQYSATNSGIVPAAGNVSETGEWKLLSNMGWLTVGAIPDYDSQYIYWARKYSPAFTGVPTAPTAASGTDTTQIATTAFVQDAMNSLTCSEIAGTTQAAFEAALTAQFQAMSDGKVMLVRAYPNWGTSFTAGARATAALYRISNGLYKCCILDAHLWDGYYYSGAWHWNSEIATVNTRTNVQNGNALTSFDLNNLTETTIYQFDKLTSAMTNAPSTGTYFSGFLFVERYAANKVLQTFYYAGAENVIYVRTLWNGTWGSWYKMPTRAEVDALNSKTEVTVTASANVVIDTNKSYKCGNILFLNVKGHTTAALSNASMFVFAGATVNPNSFTFGIPVGTNAWGINGMAYGYINSNGVVGTIASGQYFHIAQAFLCNL